MTTALDLLRDPSLGLVKEARPAQLKMAESIERILADGGVYLVEAGTGVGKSYAYLVPALLAEGRRVVVATAKKALQDQILGKDLPRISEVMKKQGLPPPLDGDKKPQIPGCVVKGKGNYACRFLAEKAEPGAFPQAYFEWLDRSPFGDQADYPGEPPRAWPRATAEDCIGQGCDHHADCGYIRLRQNMRQSRVVVLNHHLLGFDMFYGLGTLVGGAYDTLVVDEAHKLAEGVRAAFTVKLAENSIPRLVELLDRRAPSWTFTALRVLAGPWTSMFVAFKEACRTRGKKIQELFSAPVFPAGTDEVEAGLKQAAEELEKTVSAYVEKKGESFIETLAAAVQNVDDGAVKAELAAVGNAWRQVDGFRRGLHRMQTAPSEDDPISRNTAVYGGWQGTNPAQVVMHAAPVDVGGIVKAYLSALKSTVMTSATLAINRKFDHVEAQATRSEILESPFDYGKQGFVYIPRDLPVLERKHPEYAASLEKRAERVVKLALLARGGTFVLTTANSELEQIAVALSREPSLAVFAQDFFRPADQERPRAKNLVWGTPQAILQSYLEAPNGVLVGSKSFWEGIDVSGERLRLVIMAKLPFPMLTDPVVQARKEAAGEAWFNRVFVNDMLVDLRQGVGRLIRSQTDRGAVSILDSRVWRSAYGAQVISALPFPKNVVTADFAWCERYIPRISTYFKRLQEEQHP